MLYKLNVPFHLAHLFSFPSTTEIIQEYLVLRAPQFLGQSMRGKVLNVETLRLQKTGIPQKIGRNLTKKT